MNEKTDKSKQNFDIELIYFLLLIFFFLSSYTENDI